MASTNNQQLDTIQLDPSIISTWFQGPGEASFDLFKSTFQAVLDAATWPTGGGGLDFVEKEVDFASQQNADAVLYKQMTAAMSGAGAGSMVSRVSQYRGYMGMNFETTMPALAAYMVAMLYNQNNVATEASAVTTVIEYEVGEDLSKMLGFSNGQDKSWGHLTVDGEIAQGEVLSTGSNFKNIPLALRSAIDDGKLSFIADFLQVTPAGPAGTQPKFLKDCSVWELLNIPHIETLNLLDSLRLDFAVDVDFLRDTLRPYVTAEEALFQRHGITQPPQHLMSATNHYSWAKGAAIHDLGAEVLDVEVDLDARIDIPKLDALLQDLYKKQQAVNSILVSYGTWEGAIDPISEVLQLRDKYAELGFIFFVYADSPWGSPQPASSAPRSAMTAEQYEALAQVDAVSTDLYRRGAVPLPAGAVYYRDGRLAHWKQLFDISEPEMNSPVAMSAQAYFKFVGSQEVGPTLNSVLPWASARLSAQWAAMSDNTTDYIVLPLTPLVNEGDSAKEAAEKQFIRSQIIGLTDDQIFSNPEAMTEANALAPDLSISVFACNFMLNGQPNTDVEDASYLSTRLVNQLHSQQIPFRVDSSVMGQRYDSCVVNYRKRLGLETDSSEDLVVLRTMPTFSGLGSIDSVTSVVQGILEQEVKVVLDRATVQPQIHWFTVSGQDNIYLTSDPLFHNANGRKHLIISADMLDTTVKSLYTTARSSSPGQLYRCRTLNEMTLDDIATAKDIQVVFDGDAFSSHPSITLSNLQVIKNRPLDARWRDAQFSNTCIPFYVFGTPQEINIEHMLLRGRNAQLSADRVTLQVQPPLTADQLARGVRLEIARPETSLLPASANNPPEGIFKPGASFNVTVFDDVNAPDAHGPGLALGGTQLAQGTATLAGGVYVDWKQINQQDFTAVAASSPPPPQQQQQPSSGSATGQVVAGLNSAGATVGSATGQVLSGLGAIQVPTVPSLVSAASKTFGF